MPESNNVNTSPSVSTHQDGDGADGSKYVTTEPESTQAGLKQRLHTSYTYTTVYVIGKDHNGNRTVIAKPTLFMKRKLEDVSDPAEVVEPFPKKNFNPYKVFVQACKDGDVATVIKMIDEHQVDPSSDFSHSLALAYDYGDNYTPELLKALLFRCRDFHQHTMRTIFIQMIRFDDRESAELMLNYRPFRRSINWNDNKWIQMAYNCKSVKCFDLLLSKGLWDTENRFPFSISCGVLFDIGEENACSMVKYGVLGTEDYKLLFQQVFLYKKRWFLDLVIYKEKRTQYVEQAAAMILDIDEEPEEL